MKVDEESQESPSPGSGPVVALLLAAGAGSRMGGVCKALLELRPGVRFVDAIASSLAGAGLERAVIVLGPGVHAELPGALGAVTNPEPERGMLSSIHVALESPALAGADAIMLWPIDCPRVGAPLLRELVAVRRSQRAPIVLPSCGGRRGHPALLGRELFGELLAASLDEGARAVVRAHAGDIAYVEAGPEVLDDCDTPEELERLRRLEG